MAIGKATWQTNLAFVVLRSTFHRRNSLQISLQMHCSVQADRRTSEVNLNLEKRGMLTSACSSVTCQHWYHKFVQGWYV